MTVPAAKVRMLCVGSEVALVRASRSPEIEKLSKVELKRHAVRARKLFDKWQGLGRSQSRTRGRATGSSDLPQNTKIKAQIFRDALDAFEAQLSEPAAPPAKKPKPIPPTSHARAGEHRATRAAMRKDLKVSKRQINAQARKQHAAQAKAAVESSAAAPALEKQETAPAKADVTPATKKSAKGVKATKPVAKKKKPVKAITASTAKQHTAVTAAKQSRLVRSGKNTRMFGHYAARGKRAQARRDSKG